MKGFQQDVIDRLARIETNQENEKQTTKGHGKRIKKLEGGRTKSFFTIAGIIAALEAIRWH